MNPCAIASHISSTTFQYYFFQTRVYWRIRTPQCPEFPQLSIMSRLAIGKNSSRSVRIRPHLFLDRSEPLRITETTPPAWSCLVEWRLLTGAAMIVTYTPAATSSGSILRVVSDRSGSKGVPKSIWSTCIWSVTLCTLIVLAHAWNAWKPRHASLMIPTSLHFQVKWVSTIQTYLALAGVDAQSATVVLCNWKNVTGERMLSPVLIVANWSVFLRRSRFGVLVMRYLLGRRTVDVT
jgi:hypothetical protein